MLCPRSPRRPYRPRSSSSSFCCGVSSGPDCRPSCGGRRGSRWPQPHQGSEFACRNQGRWSVLLFRTGWSVRGTEGRTQGPCFSVELGNCLEVGSLSSPDDFTVPAWCTEPVARFRDVDGQSSFSRLVECAEKCLGIFEQCDRMKGPTGGGRLV